MNQRRLGVMLIIAGVALGLVAGILVYVQVNSAQQAAANIPKTWIVVAAQPIPERSTITAPQVDLVQLPETAISPAALRYPPLGATVDASKEEASRILLLEKGLVIGKFTPTRIARGEVISQDRLGEEALRNTPSFVLEPGKVAYAFPLRIQGGNPPNDRVILPFLNAVRPGDRLDIFFSSIEIPAGTSREEEELAGRYPVRFLYTRPIMQNIKILNVGFFPDAAGKAIEAAREERYLTMELTPEQAIELKWLKDAATLAGNLEFVLRSPQDAQAFEQTTVNAAGMALKYNLGTGR